MKSETKDVLITMEHLIHLVGSATKERDDLLIECRELREKLARCKQKLIIKKD